MNKTTPEEPTGGVFRDKAEIAAKLSIPFHRVDVPYNLGKIIISRCVTHYLTYSCLMREAALPYPLPYFLLPSPHGNSGKPTVTLYIINIACSRVATDIVSSFHKLLTRRRYCYCVKHDSEWQLTKGCPEHPFHWSLASLLLLTQTLHYVFPVPVCWAISTA